MATFFDAPVVAIAAGYAALIVSWYLRVIATNSASYRALAVAMGRPSRVECIVWLPVLIAGATLILLRMLV